MDRPAVHQHRRAALFGPAVGEEGDGVGFLAEGLDGLVVVEVQVAA
nr:hypothetical protein [Streptomyces sp. ISL-98]